MINLDYLKDNFPEGVHNKRKDILREYLQCVMLEILFDSPIGRRLTFIGGTCLRLVHDSQRFSEDLDFDNDGLTEVEFTEVKDLMLRELTLRGYEVEVQIKGKTAYRCSVKYPKILQPQGLADNVEQKLVIQIDTQAQNFDFKPDMYILNRFGVFSQIAVTPLDIIFSQKCHAILERPRNKGRDFFDVVFLLSKNVKPNYNYLAQKLNIKTPNELKERLINHWQTLNPKEQVEDVEGFLFYQKDQRKIELFGEVIKQANL
jgi:predicted nucleotidyltransferase component of viral defense system